MNNQTANLIEKKTCTKCEQEKELSEFGKNKNHKDGLHSAVHFSRDGRDILATRGDFDALEFFNGEHVTPV